MLPLLRCAVAVPLKLGTGYLRLLCVDQVVQHRLLGALPDVVHSLNPEHLILGFHLLGHFLGLCHLQDHRFALLLRCPIDLDQVFCQAVRQKQRVVKALPILFQELLPKSSELPDALRVLFVHTVNPRRRQ